MQLCISGLEHSRLFRRAALTSTNVGACRFLLLPNSLSRFIVAGVPHNWPFPVSLQISGMLRCVCSTMSMNSFIKAKQVPIPCLRYLIIRLKAISEPWRFVEVAGFEPATKRFSSLSFQFMLSSTRLSYTPVFLKKPAIFTGGWLSLWHIEITKNVILRKANTLTGLPF